MVPITKNLYHEIRKNRRLDLGFFVSSVHLSSQQTKKKKERKSHFALLPFHQACRSSPMSWAEACQFGLHKPGWLWTAQCICSNLLWQEIWPCVMEMDKSLSEADEERQIKEYLGYIYTNTAILPPPFRWRHEYMAVFTLSKFCICSLFVSHDSMSGAAWMTKAS